MVQLQTITNNMAYSSSDLSLKKYLISLNKFQTVLTVERQKICQQLKMKKHHSSVVI